MPTYKTFIRTANNWTQFAKARKRNDRRRLTIEEARQRCEWWNANRTQAEIVAGTKMEFRIE